MHLVVHGIENSESRGLMAISALTFVSDALQKVEITVLAGNDPVVHTAARCLQWDSGLNIRIAGAQIGPAAALLHATLFVAVGFKSVASHWLDAAVAGGIPTLLPLQFPDDRAGAPVMTLVRAAHDPRALGAMIVAHLGGSA